MVNLSTYRDDATASTRPSVAAQRAESIAELGCRSVIELCVGPSLERLSTAYAHHGITCTGNDIDPRWTRATLPWVTEDALAIPLRDYDAVVFAPPLSRGCSGRREDSLAVKNVTPSYWDFIGSLHHRAGPRTTTVVFTLPGRASVLRADRAAMHELVARLWDAWGPVSIEPRRDERGRVVKYVDLVSHR